MESLNLKTDCIVC